MKNQFMEIKNTLDNTNLNNKYIYRDSSTKFIYDSSSLNEVVGLNYNLQNKIIEIVAEIKKNEKRYVLLKEGNNHIGWVEIADSNLIRLYRLPKVNGKIIQTKDYTFNGFSYAKEIEQLNNRIIKAQYLFFFKNEVHLIVSKIDKKFVVPIKLSMFSKLIFPDKGKLIYLKEGTSLYFTSNYNSKIGEIYNPGYYEVISFINGTNQIRIENENQKYWIRHTENMPYKQEFSHDINTLEVIDFLTYLSESNKHYKNQNKILENKLNKVKENISYNSMEDRLYFESQLGDFNVD